MELPERFELPFSDRARGFGAVALLTPMALVLPPLAGPWIGWPVVVFLLAGGLFVAVRHYRKSGATWLEVGPDSLTICNDGSATTVAYTAVDKVFWRTRQQGFLSLTPDVSSGSHSVRLVFHDGQSMLLGAEWDRSDDLARELVAAVEATRKKTLQPGQDLDFGEVKFRGGVAYVGDKPLPPRTRCELHLSSNSLRFEPPEGRAISVPMQWVSHPGLVADLVNERADAA